jgi:hypothetical protein
MSLPDCKQRAAIAADTEQTKRSLSTLNELETHTKADSTGKKCKAVDDERREEDRFTSRNCLTF